MTTDRHNAAPGPEVAIEVRHLTVSYGSQPALLDVSVSLEKGLLIGVIGPNGSGKSTLIKAILGFVRPDFGEVLIDGRPASKLRGNVAYVPQRGAVDWHFPVTVEQVALMGRYSHVTWWRNPTKTDRQAAHAALEPVQMMDMRHRQIGQLSGGQQQRVFIARALAQDAEILLLDEPFAGVDAATESAILEVLTLVKQRGRTLVVVHHGYGPPDAVLDPDLLTAVYGGELRVFADLARQQEAASA